MRNASDTAQLGDRRAQRRRTLAALCCGALLWCANSACASKPVEETVTTDSKRSSALPAGAEPVAVAPDLPERDEDIEAAGDRIAEAITYLNARHHDRREAAINALDQAAVAMNRALHSRSRDEKTRAALHVALKDLDTATRALQHSPPDAAKQLAALNKNLDNLDLRPSTEASTPRPDAPSSPSPSGAP